jgi:hypothetical protein
MGSVDDCLDNATAESFFATLECELIDRTSFRTNAEARIAIIAFSPRRAGASTPTPRCDDAYLGSERPGKAGRGSENKVPFVAAV